MQVSETSSGSSSGTTSTTGPAHAKGDSKDEISSPLGESEYLAAQAAEARLAMARAWDDFKHSLMGAGDVRLWTKQYPWIATGTALAAGVAAGYFITPRDRDEFEQMWAKLKEKLTPSKTDNGAAYVEATDGKPVKPQEPSIFSTIVREAIKSVVPLLSSMVGGAMGSGEAAAHKGDQNPSQPNPT